MLQRIAQLLKTRVNRVVDSIETPEDLLESSLGELQDNLSNVNQALLDLTSTKEKLLIELKEQQNKINLYQEQVEAAILAKRDDLAREVLTKSQNLKQNKQVLEEQLLDLNEQIDTVETSREQLLQQITELKQKKMELLAINRVAEAQLLAKESISGVNRRKNSIADQILRAEEKIKEKQARSQAIGTLVENGVFQPLLGGETRTERELDKLLRQQKVEAEFQRLKEELINSSQPDKQTESK